MHHPCALRLTVKEIERRRVRWKQPHPRICCETWPRRRQGLAQSQVLREFLELPTLNGDEEKQTMREHRDLWRERSSPARNKFVDQENTTKKSLPRPAHPPDLQQPLASGTEWVGTRCLRLDS
jgi:hypothetical protein